MDRKLAIGGHLPLIRANAGLTITDVPKKNLKGKRVAK